MAAWYREDRHGRMVPDGGGGAGSAGRRRHRVGRSRRFRPEPCIFSCRMRPAARVDILARTLGDAVSRQWGQSVVVENRPGAGGVIASQALVTSPPDGYTLIVVASGHATNPFLYPKLPYDTFKDFTPISLLASSPNILLVRADSPFKTVADMIARPRRNRAACPSGMPAPELRPILPASC